jgi:hypothetical protein
MNLFQPYLLICNILEPIRKPSVLLLAMKEQGIFPYRDTKDASFRFVRNIVLVFE